MKKIWDDFVSVGFLGMAIAVSIFSGSTTSWQWHDLNVYAMCGTFALIVVITLIADVPNLISNFKNRSKK